MLEGFRKFIARGNMVDMAVGVVMGGAVTAVVNAIVNGVINPFIAMIFGKPDMNGLLAFTINDSTVSFGMVLGSLINFLIISAAVYFCIVVPINHLRDISEKTMARLTGKDGDVAEEEPDLSPEEQTVILLQDIRDQLEAQNKAADTAVAAAPKAADK